MNQLFPRVIKGQPQGGGNSMDNRKMPEVPKILGHSFYYSFSNINVNLHTFISFEQNMFLYKTLFPLSAGTASPRVTLPEMLIWLDAFLKVKTHDWRLVLQEAINILCNEPMKCEFANEYEKIKCAYIGRFCYPRTGTQFLYIPV